MEYLIVILVGAAFVIFVIAREALSAEKRKKAFVRSLHENYGKLPQKEYSLDRFARIDSYYKRHRSENQIDDITWNDLNMDEVFRMLNGTFSAAGEEYLYYLLRTPAGNAEELEGLEEKIRYFAEHEDERVSIQLLLNTLGYTGKYSLYDYLENLDALGERSNWKHFIADILYLPAVGMAFRNLPVGLLCVAVLMVYHIMVYFGEKKKIDPYIVSFAYVIRLLDVAERLAERDIPVLSAQRQVFRTCGQRLEGIRRVAPFVKAGGGLGTSSNPLDMIMDYLKMIFHIDLILFNHMLHIFRKGYEEIDRLIGAAGLIDTVIAVGGWRKYLKDGWCKPDFSEEKRFLMRKIAHPLLTDPVNNDLSTETGKGILITGSNASGKSTFLRTVALNILLAQTIHTCTAEFFEMPLCRLFSSMSLKDDIVSGDSYYMAEIKAIKRILDAVGDDPLPVVCFVDEVLRGTNTVERIAASVEILRGFTGQGVMCFAATHDVELTRLLEGEYVNYHFEEEIADGDVYFAYKLLKGRAESSNAIKLLGIMGYDAGIMERASIRAQAFLKDGIWR